MHVLLPAVKLLWMFLPHQVEAMCYGCVLKSETENRKDRLNASLRLTYKTVF